ncbi:MAG: four helix bundle protein [Psychrilyobacter sp.]|uniref:four helix bundle protein n=1 Tax=Psychrilyobacter sp. TaxID=2586924 RepID=UPI003C73A4BE
MKDDIKEIKSFEFAKRIIKLYKYLTTEKKEYILSKQLLRSGTSIGANIREAKYGVSRGDYHNKLMIALKEANESQYWIDLLEEEYLTKEEVRSLQEDIKELIKILVSITKKTKE